MSSVEEHDENLVGSRIKVWWPDDKKFYKGVVDSFDPIKKMHKVLYVDEVLKLTKERWEHVKEKHESKKMKTDSDSSTQHGKTDSSVKSKSMEATDSEDELKDDDRLNRTKTIPKISHKSKESTAKTGSKSKEGTPKLGNKSKDDAPKTSGKSKVDSGGKSEKIIAKTDIKLQKASSKTNTHSKDASASKYKGNTSRTTSVSKPKDDTLKIGSKSKDVSVGETGDCITKPKIGSDLKDVSLKLGSKSKDGCPAGTEKNISKPNSSSNSKEDNPKLGRKSRIGVLVKQRKILQNLNLVLKIKVVP
ncbi:DNA mismatch repair protein MSH6 isoform X2 [Papaver somniferum]|nr:DNA mismatch repair protein MSH6 isoform X2 [Papaver somniferum]